MGWLERFRRRQQRAVPGVRGASSETLDDLRQFLTSRDGVEAFIEPATAVYAMTVLAVAGDGEYLRRPVRDEKQARKLCAEHGVPFYEARRVGYPQRMKDYERGVPQRRITLDDLPPLQTTEDRGSPDD